ncbi:MAG: type I-C CRISPR-associated protein Cas8c/Csd1 [Proteobacteria bacterium]|nr:type I-C CRISPR-associated protein Cas8c/Csd1 [Pseudomonadota bacterium]
MMLKSLYDFALNQKLLSVENRAFESKAIEFVIDLNEQGDFLGIIVMKYFKVSCPVSLRKKSVGGVADFLADGLIALFGIDLNNKKRSQKQQLSRDRNNQKKFQNFWHQIEEAHEATQASSLLSIMNFKRDYGVAPDFIRFGPKQQSQDQEEDHSQVSPSDWWITMSDGSEKKLRNADRLTFAINGNNILLDEEYIRPYWLGKFEEELLANAQEATLGLCSITGLPGQPIALTHSPKIERVPDTQSFGASIVSFDKAAFTSFDFKQSMGAAASIEASTGYIAALNYMLEKNSPHSISLGPSVCVFWLKDSESSQHMMDLNNLLRVADPEDVERFLKSLWSSKMKSTSDINRFYALVLAGNAGRIIIRQWIDISLKEAEKNFSLWFEDLAIQPMVGGQSHVGLTFLAKATVRDLNDLRNETVNQLFLAALTGQAPSVVLLHHLLSRLRIDLAKDGSRVLFNHARFALIRLIINRNRRIHPSTKENHMEIPAKLDDRLTDPGYLCGRLLAVLSRAQAMSHNYKLKGSGVAERYFGTAMTTPQSVFPLLMKLNRHHLAKLDKSDRANGFADDYIQRDIQDIVRHLDDFPRTLDLKGQGRFVLGYYQEQAATQASIAEAK